MKRINITTIDTNICKVTGKRQYNTKDEAEFPRKCTSKINGIEYSAYQCKYCGKWHVGRYHVADTRKESKRNMKSIKNGFYDFKVF